MRALSALSYAWSLPVTWRRWRSHHAFPHIRKTRAAHKLHGWTRVIASRVLHFGNTNFRPICSRDVDLDPM